MDRYGYRHIGHCGFVWDLQIDLKQFKHNECTMPLWQDWCTIEPLISPVKQTGHSQFSDKCDFKWEAYMPKYLV